MAVGGSTRAMGSSHSLRLRMSCDASLGRLCRMNFRTDSGGFCSMMPWTTPSTTGKAGSDSASGCKIASTFLFSSAVVYGRERLRVLFFRASLRLRLISQEKWGKLDRAQDNSYVVGGSTMAMSCWIIFLSLPNSSKPVRNSVSAVLANSIL